MCTLPFKLCATLALSVALVVGSVDFILGFLEWDWTDVRRMDGASLRAILPSVAFTTTSVFALCAGLALLVLNPLGRVTRVHAGTALLAIHAGMLIAALLALLLAFLGDSLQLPPWNRLLGAGLLGALLLLRSLHRWSKEESFRLRLASCSGGLALVVLETAAVLWMFRFQVKSTFAVIALWALAVPAVVFTAWTLFGARPRMSPLPLLAALFAAIVAFPLAFRNRSIEAAEVDAPRAASARSVSKVLLLVVDTLRPDFLSCYREGAAPTPHLDALAADGILFENARSPAPWTLPAMASLMTGVSPDVHQLVDLRVRLPRALPTLAERMKHAGYRTAGIVHNPLLGPGLGMKRGFDEYVFFPRRDVSTPLSTWMKGLFEVRSETRPEPGDAQQITSIACEWIAAHRDEDFFLWLHYFDPHYPYEPPAAHRPEGPPPAAPDGAPFQPFEVRAGRMVLDDVSRAKVREWYAAEVAYVDECIGRLVRFLRDAGLYDESLLVFTSDHGEEFWEHGSVEHGQSLYDELLRVPLLIKPPRATESRRLHHSVSTEDLPATILGLCELEPQQWLPETKIAQAGSKSLLGREQDSAVMSTGLYYYENRISLVFDQHKYIRFVHSDREELYDLSTDKGEVHSLVTLAPPELEFARRLLREHRLKAEAMVKDLDIGTEERTLEYGAERELRMLGYLK